MSDQAKRWSEIATLFDELVELDASLREHRLTEIADTDPEMADEVRALLAADASANTMLDSDVASSVPSVLTDLDCIPGDGVVGPYRLLRSIGVGGMGEVWLAERTDGAYEQHVAVKLLKRGMDSNLILRRFLQERQILARLHHNHIVRLVDGGMSREGRPFYVMDFVDGQPITDYAAAHALGVRARTILLASVADAVAYAHSQLIVHRDLKPSNVLVNRDGEPRVLDFGIAKLIEETDDATMTGIGMRVLSPAYAAPEQILGEPVGTATDVYALGLMLCELLTGQLPPQRQTTSLPQLAADVSQHVMDRASVLARNATPARIAELYGKGTAPKQIAAQVSRDLDLIIATALQREPARRYQTASAFADDLRRSLEGRPISARADSTTYRFNRFVRRHRVGVAAAALISVSLIGGMGTAMYQADKARHQANVAQQQAARAERVKAFLVQIFQQNDPSIAQGKELSAAEILRRGQASLDTSLVDDPQTRGELLVTIAEIQGKLGQFNDALASVQKGIPLLQANAATGAALLAYGYTVRGEIYASTDRIPAAESDLRKARDILRDSSEDESDQLDRAESELAYVLNRAGSTADALALQTLVVARVQKREGGKSLALVRQQLLFGVLLEDMGDYANAESQYRHAIPILTSAEGALHPTVCEAEKNFAGLLDRLSKRDEAAAHFERAVDCTITLFGPSSRPYAEAVFSRGIMLLGQRQYADAETDFRATLAVFDDPSSSAAHSHRYLGRALEEQGRYTQASEEFREAERIYRAIDTPRDTQRWRARADYGYAVFKAGSIETGRAAVDAALAGLTAELPSGDSPELLRPLRALGEIAREQGELPIALQAHRRWRELAVKLYGSQSRDAYQSAHQLSIDLHTQGDRDGLLEAQTLMAEALPLARAEADPRLPDYEQTQRIVLAAIAKQPAQ